MRDLNCSVGTSSVIIKEKIVIVGVIEERCGGHGCSWCGVGNEGRAGDQMLTGGKAGNPEAENRSVSSLTLKLWIVSPKSLTDW